MEEVTKQLSRSEEATTPTRNDVIVFRNDPDCSIAERLSPKDTDINNDPVRIIEALCVHVEPRACSRVVKELSSTLPIEDCLSHLKRVRRRPSPGTNAKESMSKSTTPTGQKELMHDTSTSKGKNDQRSCRLPIDSRTSKASDRPKKRHKPNFVLEILIGTPSRVHLNREVSVVEHPIVREFGPLHSVFVPKYEPRSEQEWKEHNASWPTLYHPLRFEEHKRQQLALSETELNRIQELMNKCISMKSVFIVDPKIQDPKTTAANNESNEDSTIDIGIVSISKNEMSRQDQASVKNQQEQKGSLVSLLSNNPLATPILLALQGVSRSERQVKLNLNGATTYDIHSKDADEARKQQEQKKRGQYICTGYDMYSFYEPNVFEAMACLHSRLRRLVYFVPSRKGESLGSSKAVDPVAWGNGISKHDVHNLSGTNHNYRAFEYRQSQFAP